MFAKLPHVRGNAFHASWRLAFCGSVHFCDTFMSCALHDVCSSRRCPAAPGFEAAAAAAALSALPFAGGGQGSAQMAQAASALQQVRVRIRVIIQGFRATVLVLPAWGSRCGKLRLICDCRTDVR